MSESYAYIDTLHLAVTRVDTGDAILVDNRKDPRWLRVVEWVKAGNEIAPEPDISAVTQAREAVRKALAGVDWQTKVDTIAAGRVRLDSLKGEITAIRDATSLAQVKAALIPALNDEAVLLTGLVDEAEDNLLRWRKLMQTLALIDPL